MSERSPRSRSVAKLKTVAAIGVSMAALGFGVLVGMNITSSGQPGVAEARGFFSGIPAQMNVQEGEVLYTVARVYTRYGPAAEELLNLKLPKDAVPPGVNPDRPLPSEHTTIETWIQFASPTLIVRERAIITDDKGEVFQDNQTDPANVAAGVFAHANVPRERALRLERQLEDGTAKVLEKTDSYITIETTVPYEDPFPYGRSPGTIEIPFVTDLNPKEDVEVTVIRNDGVLLSWQRYVVTDSGERVLAESREHTHVEVLQEAPRGTWAE